MASASASIFECEWYISASTTTELEQMPITWNFKICYEEQLKIDAKKEIERKRDCKMRNKLKRVGLFTKKGLY